MSNERDNQQNQGGQQAAASRSPVSRARPISPVRAASRVDKAVSAKAARTSRHFGSCS
jgi:hypothetical protein